MRVLITGARGFTGRHLIDHLRGRPGLRLFLTAREFTKTDEHHGTDILCDLLNLEDLRSVIARSRPDQMYHLAGSFTNDYNSDYAGNVLSTKNVLDAVRDEGRPCRILLVGSSAEYGRIRASDNPVSEKRGLAPVTTYGLTKAFQTCLFHYYFEVYGMNVVMARTFNLLGKGLSERLFVGSLYAQIERLKRGEISKIRVGNMSSRRDYIDIKNAVQFYEAIMNRGVAGEIYNVGSGTPITIRDLLDRILREEGLTPDLVEQSPERESRLDVDEIYADVRKVLNL